MEFRQVQCFVAVVDAGSFVGAAARLGIGQSAVSQHLARLESGLGVRLLERTSRRVALSAAGARVLPYARSVLEAVAGARAAAEGSRASRTLRLGTATGLGDRLDAVIAYLQSSEEGLSVELDGRPTDARIEAVRTGELDAAFVRGLEVAAGVELIPVWTEELMVGLPVSHPLAAQDAVPLAELAGLPLRIASAARNAPLRRLVENACAAAGFSPSIIESTAVLQDVLAVIGAAPATWSVFWSGQAARQRTPAVAFRPALPPLTMPCYLAVPQSARSGELAPLLRACAAATQ